MFGSPLPIRVLFVLWMVSGAIAAGQEWKAGAAAVTITPSQSTWMAGYGSRTKPSEGVVSDLRAKALAIEDQAGTRCVVVTTDLIAIPRVLREPVAKAAQEKFGLPPAGLLMNCSHTHCGPVVRDDLEMSVMYVLDAEQRQRVENYFVELRDKLIALVGAAIADLRPAKLSYSHARCGFAMNRRLPAGTSFQNSPYPEGPVDHHVPVLRIDSPEGQLRAVAFGYACHNTTTGIQQFNADYAGFAQTEIEAAHPGAVALFVMGCGGDQNPYPRGQIELARYHGKSLALAVEAALTPQPRPLQGKLQVSYEDVPLAFVPVTREELTRRLESKDGFERRGAEVMLREANTNGKVRESYNAPVQVLQFGRDLTLVALPGETVVDYSLRIQREFGQETTTWVSGYNNDVFAYIPSERVLREGGYEGATAMRYAALPGPFASGVETQLMASVARQVQACREKASR